MWSYPCRFRQLRPSIVQQADREPHTPSFAHFLPVSPYSTQSLYISCTCVSRRSKQIHKLKFMRVLFPLCLSSLTDLQLSEKMAPIAFFFLTPLLCWITFTNKHNLHIVLPVCACFRQATLFLSGGSAEDRATSPHLPEPAATQTVL